MFGIGTAHMFGTGSRQTEWFCAVARSGRRSVFALIIIALVSFLPGFFSLPAIDRDEARYAQASRQMVATGDWIDIRLQEVPRYHKPIGIYWLQSALVSSFGTDAIAPIWVHRLPSLAGATGAVLLTYWLALALVSREAAFLAGATMAVCLLLGVEARLAKTDAVLLSTILLAQAVLARAYIHVHDANARIAVQWRPWLYPLLFWSAVAAGILVKGPIIVLYVGLTIVAISIFERSFSCIHALNPTFGLLWCLALAAPWYVAIGFQSEGAFYQKAIGFSVAGKIVEEHEGHGAPPLTHAAWLWAIYWPGSLLFALSIVQLWRQRREPWLRFLIYWALPSWIAMELVVTKLPHYILPALPAISIAAARVVVSNVALLKHRAVRISMAGVVSLITIVALAAIVTASWIAGNEKLTAAMPAYWAAAFVCFSVLLFFALRALRDQKIMTLTSALFGSAIAFYWMMYPSIAQIDRLWPARQLANIIDNNKQCEKPFLVSAGYHEPSLVFSTRTDLVLTNGADAADMMAGRICSLGLIEKRQRAAFMDRAREIGAEFSPAGQADGFNIGGGREIEMVVYAPKQPSNTQE